MKIIIRIATALILLGCFACSNEPSRSASPPSGDAHSLEFGHTTGNSDHGTTMNLPADFGNGALFSVWTRIPVPVTDAARGNMNVYFINGDNWSITCLAGNLSINPDGSARYNANFMLGGDDGAWIGDFCTYYSLQSEAISMEAANGWVWIAWQVVSNPDHSMTLRQWIKFGPDGVVRPAGYWNDTDIPGEETVTAGGTSVEGWNIPADFSPSPPRSFRIGDDNTWSGVNTPSNSYLWHARLEARTTKPTLAELETIATRTGPDSAAWGDWALEWTNDAADITDRSGHGNHLQLESGAELFPGPAAPVF